MLSFSEFKALCEARHSVRYFDAKPVTREEIEELLTVAALAPSVDNIQPWHFHIIMEPALHTKLMEASCYGNFVVGAGVFIVVTCNKKSRPNSPEIVWNPKELEYSCIAAMEHLVLGATARGLGSCWVSLHHGIAHEALKLEGHDIVIGGIMLGRMRADEAAQTPAHERRRITDMYTIHD